MALMAMAFHLIAERVNDFATEGKEKILSAVS
jgi:hypothetical protein